MFSFFHRNPTIRYFFLKCNIPFFCRATSFGLFAYVYSHNIEYAPPQYLLLLRRNGVTEATPSPENQWFSNFEIKLPNEHPANGVLFFLEQGTGIEPASVAWEATVLPMN